MVLMYLKNPRFHRSEKNALLIIELFNVMWSCIMGNPKNEEIFLESEGFYTLLEYLESALSIHYKLILGTISGIMENRKSFKYFDEWVSSSSTLNATQLLL